jgi:hypothetical protein
MSSRSAVMKLEFKTLKSGGRNGIRSTSRLMSRPASYDQCRWQADNQGLATHFLKSQ